MNPPHSTVSVSPTGARVSVLNEGVLAVLEKLDRHVAASPKRDGGDLILRDVIRIIRGIRLGAAGHILLGGVDELIETVKEVEKAYADLTAGAEAQMRELAEELDRIQKGSEGLSDGALELIERELERRAQESSVMGGMLERIEDERSDTRRRLRESELQERGSGDRDTASLKRKLEMLNQNLESLQRTVRESEAETEQLKSYLDAVVLVRKGLPANLIRKTN